MAFSPKTFEEKPYNMCLNCVHIGKNCDGPNFLTMTSDRWSEWCKLRKEYLGWTNAHVAELAQISKISVDRVMSGSIKDIRTSTMQAITKALVNGSWGQHPCAMPDLAESKTVYVDNPDLLAKLEAAEEKCRNMEKSMEAMKEKYSTDVSTVQRDEKNKILLLNSQIAFHEDQIAKKDRMLAEQYKTIQGKNKIVIRLGVALAALMAIIIFYLIAKL